MYVKKKQYLCRVMEIKLFLCDVDGTLTDGGMYYSADGDELKRFYVRDGMGMVLLQKQGVRCGILTSETTDIVLRRARKLNLDYLYMGVGRVKDHAPVMRYAPATDQPEELPFMTKREAAEEICRELGITLAQVCYVGDDVNDIDLLQVVGYAACPQDAVDEVKTIQGIHILTKEGGKGAVRELTDRLRDGREE